jgi:AsmA protein
MQKARVLGGLVGAIVVLLGALLLAVWLWVNPNNYQGRIAAAVKQSTGLDLHLTGDIKLSVLPWVALEVGPASLGNPPGFGDQPLLSVTHATLRLKLLPLLRRRLEITRVELDGLDLRLRKNAQGGGNWQDASATTQSTWRARADETGLPRSFAVFPAVRIHDGRVSFEDITLDHLNLETASVAQSHDIPFSITFGANRGVPGEQLTVNARFDLSADSTRPLRLAAVNLSGTLTRRGEERPIPWEFSAPVLVVDPSQQTAQAAALTFSYASARLTGSIAATKLWDDLSLKGSVTLAPLVLREFGQRVGMAIPQTKDAKAWSQLSGSADITCASKAWTLKNIQAHLDETEAQGNIELSTGDTKTLTFDLAADQIDLDRYRVAGESATGQDKITHQSSDTAKTPFAMDGTLTAARTSFSGMHFTHLRLTVASKDGVTHLFPMEAQIDGGRYSGDITLDGRGAVRSVSIDGHLLGVDMARLLAKSAQKGRLSGRATLNVTGIARGESMDELLKTLNGHLDAELADGVLEGIDLEYERNRAQALVDGAAAPRDDTKRTKFAAFKTSAQITNGIAETHDLTISTQVLRVTGQGSANLSTKAINFQLLASIFKAPAKTLADIPFKVTGTYADPIVKADLDPLVKHQLKQKLQDILKKNGLQGLFGK